MKSFSSTGSPHSGGGNESTLHLNVAVYDRWQGQGALIVFDYHETTNVGGRCDNPLQDELTKALPPNGPGLRFGDIEARGCSLSPRMPYGRDGLGCWTIKFTVTCPIECVKGKPGPLLAHFGVYGPIGHGDDPSPGAMRRDNPRYNASNYSRHVGAAVQYDESTCCLAGCDIGLDTWYENFFFEHPDIWTPPNPWPELPTGPYDLGAFEDYNRQIGLVRKPMPVRYHPQ